MRIFFRLSAAKVICVSWLVCSCERRVACGEVVRSQRRPMYAGHQLMSALSAAAAPTTSLTRITNPAEHDPLQYLIHILLVFVFRL